MTYREAIDSVCSSRQEVAMVAVPVPMQAITTRGSEGLQSELDEVI